MKTRFLTLTVILSVPFAALSQDYEIKLNRPKKPGEEYRMDVTGKMSQQVNLSSDGNTVKDDNQAFTVKCSGVEKVIEVNTHGVETKISFTVDELVRTADGKDTALASKGSVITASRSGKQKTIEIDGKPVDPGMVKTLDIIFPLASDDHSDDDLFGAKDHKKAGDQWDINTALASALFEEDIGGPLNDLAGKMTLESVTKGSDGDLLKIAGHFSGSPRPPLPSDFTMDQSKLAVTMDGLFPADAAKPRPEQSMSMEMSIAAHGQTPDGKTVVLKMSMVESATDKETKLK